MYPRGLASRSGSPSSLADGDEPLSEPTTTTSAAFDDGDRLSERSQTRARQQESKQFVHPNTLRPHSATRIDRVRRTHRRQHDPDVTDICTHDQLFDDHDHENDNDSLASYSGGAQLASGSRVNYDNSDHEHDSIEQDSAYQISKQSPNPPIIVTKPFDQHQEDDHDDEDADSLYESRWARRKRQRAAPLSRWTQSAISLASTDTGWRRARQSGRRHKKSGRKSLATFSSTSSVFALYAAKYAFDKFQLALRAFKEWYHEHLTYHHLRNRMEFNQQQFERWYKSRGCPLSLRALDRYDQMVIWISGEWWRCVTVG